VIPRDTILGPLRVLEVYEDYDGPRLFSAVNTAGHKYLSVWLGTEGRTERWLYVPVSDARLAQLRRGTVALRAAFAEPEGGSAVRVEIDRTSGQATASRVEASRLSDDELPERGETLSDEPLSDDPKFANRELLELALELPEGRRTEAPLTVVGGLLQNLQKTIDAIGQALVERVSGFGPIPAAIKQQTLLTFAETFEGSFGMRVASAAAPELFAESLVGRSLGEFVALVEAGSDEDSLRAMLRKLHSRTAVRYGALLMYLSSAGADVKVHWRPGRSRVRKAAFLACADAAKAVEIIKKHEEQEPLEIDVVGVLTGVVLPSRTFRLEVPAQRRFYAGTITDDGMHSVEHAKMSETYRARLREIPEVSSVTDEITTRYELVRLSVVRK
jgi:hypothetical protein